MRLCEKYSILHVFSITFSQTCLNTIYSYKTVQPEIKNKIQVKGLNFSYKKLKYSYEFYKDIMTFFLRYA